MQPFVAIDFETANRNRGSACSVGLVKFGEDGRVVSVFNSLLKPHPSICYFDGVNVSIHGIEPGQVEFAPSWGDVAETVYSFVGGLPLVAHNMAFDGYVAYDLAQLYGLQPFPNERFCTVRLSKALFPNLPSHRLDQMFQIFYPELDFNHHDATADAQACGMLFATFQNNYGIETLRGYAPPKCGYESNHGSHGSKPLFTVKNQVSFEDLANEFNRPGLLSGQVVCVTGALDIASRADVKKLVVYLGGQVCSSVTKSTTILVCGAPKRREFANGAKESSKTIKARTLRDSGHPIDIFNEEEFLSFLKH